MSALIAVARDAWRLVGARRPWKWALIVVLALLVAGFEAVGAGLVFGLVSMMSSENGAPTLPVLGDLSAMFPETPRRSLQLWVAGTVAVFFALRSGLVVGQQYVQARIVQNAGADVANRLVRGYLTMPYLFHTTRNSSELVRNAFDSAQRLVSHIMMPLVNIVADTVLVVGLVMVMVALSPQATVLAVGVLFPAVWLLQRFVQPRLKLLGRRSQTARKGSLQSLQQALGGFRDIRLIGREEHFARTFEKQRVELARSEYSKAALASLPRALIESALVLVIISVLVATMVVGQSLDSAAATLSVFAYVGLRLQPSLQKIVQGLNEIRFGSAVLDDVAADQGRISENERSRRAGAFDAPAMEREIRFEEVRFSYTPEAGPVLAGVNLVIRRGEFIGICGPTGGGKSTLVDLLVGLLPPTDGKVSVDGVSIAGREAWWQEQLGVVSQNVFLIDDSLRANILFGRKESGVDGDALRRAISRAQLADVIDGLPNGLDTPVGERGVRLSGGQRQRVAIARALYREPAVLVFDEGTSALDTATETALVGALEELKAGRTLVTVAHRISTVRDADRIFVVTSGRISAEGSYDQLMETSDLFRTLAR